MTERLYYNQTYLKEFDATVIDCLPGPDGSAMVVLDRSCFYPTSGGQPFDTGVLSCEGKEYHVTNVTVEKEGDSSVFHYVEAGLKIGDHVHGIIDWDRRFDHMQQHGGEHMLAGIIWNLMHGTTIGLHLGKDNSTIDVTFPDGRTRLSEEDIQLIEEAVNARIHEDSPIRCWFPDADELATLPLRKAPTVNEHVRIVAMGDYEMVACGGTHPSSTGQIGCIRIESVTPERGKARFSFACGMRAVHKNRQTALMSEKAGAALSCPVSKLPETIENMKEKLNRVTYELKKTRTELIGIRLEELAVKNPHCIALWLEDNDPDALTEAVKTAVKKQGRIIIAGTAGRLVFARSEDETCDMGKLIRTVGKGGGRPDFATGAGDRQAIEKAVEILTLQ